MTSERYPRVRGRCPACYGSSLFLGEGGYVTCSRLECTNPTAADSVLNQGAFSQQPDDALRVAALEVMKSYEAYVALGSEPGPDTTGAPPKPEDEWDEYDYMMIPRWRALKAALDAVRLDARERSAT